MLQFVRSPLLRVSRFGKTHKTELVVVVIILIVGAFLRLYRISEYMTFLGDEGRDVILVRRLLVNFDLILIGPATSIGNMYLGPLYYYLMAPAQLLAGLSPVGPAVQIAVLGVITIGLVWWIAREWFGPIAGMVASTLYAASPVIIVHAHSSWNPNIMPFFALLVIYALWRIWHYHQWRWLIMVGVSYSFVLQSHYLGLLLVIPLVMLWIFTLYEIRNSRLEIQNFGKNSLIGLVIFAVLMSPLVIFDARHGWHNFQAMEIFFTKRQETVSFRPWNAIPQMWPVWSTLFVDRFLGAQIQLLRGFLAGALLIGGGLLLFMQRTRLWRSPLLLLLLWMGSGIVGLSLLKQNIYDHYFGFMFAGPFILTGALVERLAKMSTVAKTVSFGAVLVLVVLNISQTPIKNPPQRQLQRTEEVARLIAKEAGGRPLNLAVIAERNYEDAYQYFLEWWREPVRDIDPLNYKETVADQLFVVCELPPLRCDPTHSSKAEVANFGWSKVDREWEVAGVKVYKLVHNPGGKSQ